ncbi:MAG TPA: hypothetical protein VGO80_18725 [Solirubrobacteraceae bacterium]|jgi:hypothetical protein|nr:hypothetical protein [Solirubrobacteraceae bacterium]
MSELRVHAGGTRRSNNGNTKGATARATADVHGSATATATATSQDELAALLTNELRANCRLNLFVRAALGLFGLTAAVVALLHAAGNSDAIAAAASGGGSGLPAMLAATLPIVLPVLLSALAGLAAWAVHSRGVEEMYSTLDTVSRIKREGEVAVSARGLIYAFEEKLQNARRAFTLLLWLGRTMFLVCLGLFAASIINVMAGGDEVLSLGLGVTSVGGALLGVVRSVPRNITHNLADVIQIQSIITGCDRQISLLETAALSAVNHNDDLPAAHQTVLDVQRRMDHVVARAVERVEFYSDPERREKA